MFFILVIKNNGDGKDRDTDRSKEKDTGLGQKERFSHILLIRNIHRGLE